ncbi:MAG TPA: efflux RND transporter periplasmic adaptor subunit, partial [Verrucomicrobiae bacterium]|nr:efflux RND transporter periplasmic adaptor subunit [Verrucomicrobiae bacterium]
TEPKRRQKPKRPLSPYCLPNGYSIFLTALRTKSRTLFTALGFAPFIAALAITFAGCSGKPDADTESSPTNATNVTLTAEQQKHIHVYRVEPSEFHKTVEVTGTVDFDQDQATTVLAPFSGPVSQLLVSPGQQVSAAEPLAKVESPDFATAIGTYRKTLAAAKAARQLADLDQKLLQHHSVPQKEADQAESDAIGAESDRDAARQQLVALQVAPETIKAIEEGKPAGPAEGIIRAPIAGTVVEKLITPGQLLQSGSTPCFTVADISRVWVMAHLFAPDLADIHTGDPAEINTGLSTNDLAGTVDNISALVDPDTRSVVVRVVADNPENLLKKNMYARVKIQARQPSKGMLVPVSAILRDSENLPFVYVAQADNSFARQLVGLGSRVEDQYEIISGLKPEDQVVIEGGLFVQFQQNQ